MGIVKLQPTPCIDSSSRKRNSRIRCHMIQLQIMPVLLQQPFILPSFNACQRLYSSHLSPSSRAFERAVTTAARCACARTPCWRRPQGLCPAAQRCSAKCLHMSLRFLLFRKAKRAYVDQRPKACPTDTLLGAAGSSATRHQNKTRAGHRDTRITAGR